MTSQIRGTTASDSNPGSVSTGLLLARAALPRAALLVPHRPSLLPGDTVADMTAKRLNREQFFDKLAGMDQAQLRKVLWTLY